MMSDGETTVETARGTASTGLTHLYRGLYATLIIGFLVGWSAFWVAVARLHYAMDDLLSAAFVAALFVVPVTGVALKYALQWADIDPTPDFTTSSTSN